jgi:uncharacterized protein
MESIFLKNLFTSDLHGNKKKYALLFRVIEKEKPNAVFIGGDIFPNTYSSSESVSDFLEEHLFQPLKRVRKKSLKEMRVFIILGNDDPRINEECLIKADKEQLIDYVNGKTVPYNEYFVTGYSYIPPTPFQLKDWEKYDISRYVEFNSISPEEGYRSVKVEKDIMQFSTISEDLKKLVKNAPPEKTIFLFHAPPYGTNLDRADLDGIHVDHAPLDVHIGSIAIQRFIKKFQPHLTLHGHVHETVRLTNKWRELIGKTYAFSGSHEQHEFCYISFDLHDLEKASRAQIMI